MQSLIVGPLTCPTTRLVAPPALAASPDLSGLVLPGALRLMEPVGQGAYGRVYRARQLSLHRDVAVKILDPELRGAPEYSSRLCREATAACSVRHPNTVEILDLGLSADGLLFLVMEFVHGVTLTELLRRAAPLPIARVLALIEQVMHAIEAIHAAGIVHADLKTDNVMVEHLHRVELVKVVDFGIAQLPEAALVAAPIAGAHAASWSSACVAGADAGVLAGDGPANARTGGCGAGGPAERPSICGTPGYMAPEVIEGERPTGQCDVYACGVLLYQLLTGQRAFPGRTVCDVLRRQLAGEPVTPRAVRPEVPAALDAVVRRATERDPEHRFATVATLRRALAEVTDPDAGGGAGARWRIRRRGREGVRQLAQPGSRASGRAGGRSKPRAAARECGRADAPPSPTRPGCRRHPTRRVDSC